MKKYNHCDSRKGDLAEFYAVTWLWDQGYEVFPNAGSQGMADMVAWHPSTEKFILIDLLIFFLFLKLLILDNHQYEDH